jgi:hypothetical protein
MCFLSVVVLSVEHVRQLFFLRVVVNHGSDRQWDIGVSCIINVNVFITFAVILFCFILFVFVCYFLFASLCVHELFNGFLNFVCLLFVFKTNNIPHCTYEHIPLQMHILRVLRIELNWQKIIRTKKKKKREVSRLSNEHIVKVIIHIHCPYIHFGTYSSIYIFSFEYMNRTRCYRNRRQGLCSWKDS